MLCSAKQSELHLLPASYQIIIYRFHVTILFAFVYHILHSFLLTLDERIQIPPKHFVGRLPVQRKRNNSTVE